MIDVNIPYGGKYDVESIIKYNYKEINVKLEAGVRTMCRPLSLTGYIPVDIRVFLRKEYPTEEQSSLKFYLEKFGLNSKDHMPYDVLFDIYAIARKIKKLSNGYKYINGVLEYNFDNIKINYNNTIDTSILAHDDDADDTDDDNDLTDNVTHNLTDNTIDDSADDSTKIILEDDLLKIKSINVKQTDISLTNVKQTDISLTKNDQKPKISYRETILNLKNALDRGELTDEIYYKSKLDAARVNKYCVEDSNRCHDLIRLKNIISDSREVSTLAFVSLYDSFYFANGMKVRNITIANGQEPPFNIKFSNISICKDEDGKYPGAMVLQPNKGLKISKLSIKERIAKAKKYNIDPSVLMTELIGLLPTHTADSVRVIDFVAASITCSFWFV